MKVAAAAPLDLLKSHFGYAAFRPLQEEIIGHTLAGGDSLALMPTGGGKSLCYQLPALMFPGLTLVVSPLIALMKDQVDALNANGIAARFINSSQHPKESDRVQAEVARGEVKILYVSPERLSLANFRRFLKAQDLSLLAIDEAHCISEWGHEFRPEYRNLRSLRADFPDTPLIALTATATERVRADIINQLGLQSGRVFLASFNRANLSYAVLPKGNSWGALLSLLREHRQQSAIIYCFSRRETEELAADLNERGLAARPYHAGLDSEVRRQNQEDFIRDRVPIIVATIAFGMGIDKPDIRLVVHYSLPKSLESYYQETGRAGRDGLPGRCVLFYNHADKARQDFFINQMEDETEQRQARRMLSQMVEFAQLPTCRRRRLLEYFGEQWPADNCGGCDVCLAAAVDFDATEVAQKILSAVIRTGQRFGVLHIAQVLTGSRDKRLQELGHHQLSVYGIVRDFGREELRELMGHLLARGLLTRNEGEYPTLAVTDRGRRFLQDREKLILPRPQRKDAPLRPAAAGRAAAGEEYDAELFEELRGLRRQLAEAQDVPTFIIFGDVSLRQMAARYPQSLETFSQINGVGSNKLAQYGDRFVAAIRDYAIPRGLAERTDWPPRQAALTERRQDTRRPSPGNYPSRTQDATRAMLAERVSLAAMARRRGLTEATLLSHLERMTLQGEKLDLAHLLPPPEPLAQINAAFDACGDDFLKPAWQHLEGKIPYNDLRLVRVYRQQQAGLGKPTPE